MHLLLSLDKKRAVRSTEIEDKQPIHVDFNFHGVKVRIHTNSSYLTDHLKLGYSYFETHFNGNPHISLLALEGGKPHYNKSIKTLFPEREVKDHILVSKQLKLIFFLKTQPLFAYYTVKALFGLMISFLRERFIGLHAAALVYKGNGMVLCGAARCGKTILTTLLIEQDLSYSSDDVTLVDRKSLKVVPFPRALTVRVEYERLISPLLVRARQVQRMKVADQERLLVDLKHPVPGEVEPKVICLPKYESGFGTQLIPISPGIMLVALMNHRFHPLVGSLEDDDSEDFEMLSNLVDRTSCFKLTFSDPVEASSVLKDIILKEDSRR